MLVSGIMTEHPQASGSIVRSLTVPSASSLNSVIAASRVSNIRLPSLRFSPIVVPDSAIAE